MRLCRRVVGVILGLGLEALLRYAPLDRNCADGPSLLWAIGVVLKKISLYDVVKHAHYAPKRGGTG